MLKEGNRVKQKHTVAKRIGTVVGIWEKDEYYLLPNGDNILFACKNEVKVQFDYAKEGSYATFSEQELELIETE
jgi:hypothetical protein